MATGFQFDLNRCTGCRACELACSIENELPWDRSWRRVSTANPRRAPGIPTFHLSLACNHCESAPCIEQCPALAIRRDPDTGAVLIDDASCIGCRYCSWACPYDAPLFDHDTGGMTKCTLCNHRLHDGLEPACVAGCPTGALNAGDVASLSGSTTAPAFPDRPHDPNIRFVPLRDGVAATPDPGQSVPLPPAPGPRSKIELRAEWPLLVFSLLAIALVTLLGGHVAGRVELTAPVFAGLAAAAAGVSTLHLGRKRRAWRAVLNIRHSWLSREIASFTAFAGAGTAALLFAPGSVAATGAALGLGAVALFCIDRVYDVAERAGFSRLHSADCVIAAATLLAAWTGPTRVAGLLLTGLWMLHLLRHGSRWPRPWVRRILASARLLSTVLALGALWWLPDGSAVFPLAFGAVIDRIEFYLELEVPSPRRELAALERRHHDLNGAPS